MGRKVFVAALLCVLITSSSYAASFVDYPTLGRSTGDGVRLRSKPSTNSKVLGKLVEGDFVIVIRSKNIDGELWYEVDHPTKKGRAYVFGKYLEPCYIEFNQHDKLQKLRSSLEMTYGMNIQKAEALFEKTNKLTSRKSEHSDYQRVTLDWGTHNVSFIDDDLLVVIQVKSGNTPFGNIHIGDYVEKLRRELGEPTFNNDDESWRYQIEVDYGGETETSYATFTFKNDKIIRMYYEVPNEGSNGG